MILYDAGLGDVIDIPAHYPSRVTVTGWRGTIIGRHRATQSLLKRSISDDYQASGYSGRR